MRKLTALILAALFAVSGTALAAKADKTAKGDKKGAVLGIVKAVDAEKGTLTVQTRSKEKKEKAEETLKVAKDVKLATVKVGDRVALKVSDDRTVTAVESHEKKKQK